MLRTLIVIPKTTFTLSLAIIFATVGCKSAPAPSAGTIHTEPVVEYPVRPSVAPPAFTVFHHNESSITLMTRKDATDEEIESLIWELHDAQKAHTFDKLKIEQKWVDARDPMMSFHIYRGSKCASEKYAGGTPPCGGSYHAAGEYTVGGFTNRDRDDGVLLQGEDRQTQLWNADAPSDNKKPMRTRVMPIKETR